MLGLSAVGLLVKTMAKARVSKSKVLLTVSMGTNGIMELLQDYQPLGSRYCCKSKVCNGLPT